MNVEISDVLKFMHETFSRIEKHQIKNGKRANGVFSAEWDRMSFVFLFCFIQIRNYLFLFHKIQPKVINPPIDLLSLWLNPDGLQPSLDRLRKQLQRNYPIAIQRNFVVEFEFHVEYILKAVSLKLDADREINGYWKYVNFITENLDFEDPVKIKHALLAPSYVRNSLHGGVFDRNNTSVIVRNKKYDFVKGKGDDWMKWEIQFIFVDECLTALEQINTKMDSKFFK